MASPAPDAAPAASEENEAPDTEPKDTQSRRGRKAGDMLYRKPTLPGNDKLDAETYSEDHRLVEVQGNADPEDGGKWYKYAGKSNPSGSKFACLSQLCLSRLSALLVCSGRLEQVVQSPNDSLPRRSQAGPERVSGQEPPQRHREVGRQARQDEGCDWWRYVGVRRHVGRQRERQRLR